MEIIIKNAYSCVKLRSDDGTLYLSQISFNGDSYVNCDGVLNSYLYFLGEGYRGKQFNRYCVNGENLEFCGYENLKTESGDVLVVTEKNEKAEVKTFFTLFNEFPVIEVKKSVKNLSEKPLVLECVSPLCFSFGLKNENCESLEFYRGDNSWCCEYAFEKISLTDGYFTPVSVAESTAKFAVTSNGSQTTNKYLPLGLIKSGNDKLVAFELTPSGSWSYELDAVSKDDEKRIFVALTGKNYADNFWYKTLAPNETYDAESVRVTGGKDVDDVVRYFTAYRRLTRVKHAINACDKVIYNNFMHNTYDNPTEESDAVHSVCVKACGADYYVVDAGWHDARINGISPTQAIGKWYTENVSNYPSGFIKTVDNVRKLGMKFGLWIELQSFGKYCDKPDLLPEDCFFRVNGARPICNNRYQLDYSNPKVREYASDVIAAIVKKYSPDYIKIDYNQTALGTDCDGGSISEGLRRHYEAYNAWFVSVQNAYPDIVFETCSSGGMRNSPDTVSLSNVISVSDQNCYTVYPYILANAATGLLPEQTGVWNVPVRLTDEPQTSDEEIVMNCVNALYGVMHLAGRLNNLTEAQTELVKRGIAYYRELSKIKTVAVPVMPDGFTRYGASEVCFGLKTDEKLYLFLYNLSDEPRKIERNLSKYGVKTAKIAFPSFANNVYSLDDGVLNLSLAPNTARAMEFDLKF